MSADTHSPLAPFVDWIQADDAHAAHHLDLLRQAECALADGGGLSQSDRLALAERLERWRYLWLAERAGRVTDKDWGLVDAIDLTANRLAGRGSRPARGPRRAIRPMEVEEPRPSLRSERATPARATPARTTAERPTAERTSPERAAHCCDSDDPTGVALACLDRSIPLDELIERARQTTAARFGGVGVETGRPVLLYAPLYLSSFCINECRYCGFRFDQAIERKHLGADEAVAEAEILRGRGFRHVLLVAGEFPRLARPEYFVDIIGRLRAMDLCPAIEIAPQPTRAYAELAAAGLAGVTLYQETYDESHYRRYHPSGTKAAYDWRLEGLERAAEAGVARLGLGVLLGLADPREDVLALIGHAAYLAGRFPDVRLAFSLPRIHEAPSDFRRPYAVDDELFLRLYCTLRLAFPGANLVLSTRERPALRDRLSTICITQLSAGSCTAPGGYGHEPADGQFPVHDQRSVEEVTARLEGDGLRPVWRFEEMECSQP